MDLQQAFSNIITDRASYRSTGSVYALAVHTHQPDLISADQLLQLQPLIDAKQAKSLNPQAVYYTFDNAILASQAKRFIQGSQEALYQKVVLESENDQWLEQAAWIRESLVFDSASFTGAPRENPEFTLSEVQEEAVQCRLNTASASTLFYMADKLCDIEELNGVSRDTVIEAYKHSFSELFEFQGGSADEKLFNAHCMAADLVAEVSAATAQRNLLDIKVVDPWMDVVKDRIKTVFGATDRAVNSIEGVEGIAKAVRNTSNLGHDVEDKLSKKMVNILQRYQLTLKRPDEPCPQDLRKDSLSAKARMLGDPAEDQQEAAERIVDHVATEIVELLADIQSVHFVRRINEQAAGMNPVDVSAWENMEFIGAALQDSRKDRVADWGRHMQLVVEKENEPEMAM